MFGRRWPASERTHLGQRRRKDLGVGGFGVSGNIGALIIRIGFWGPLSYSFNKKTQNSIGNYLGPYSRAFSDFRDGFLSLGAFCVFWGLPVDSSCEFPHPRCQVRAERPVQASGPTAL